MDIIYNHEFVKDKIDKELKDFKGGSKERAISEFVANKIIMFSQNELFGKVIQVSKLTLSDCCKVIIDGVGHHISDMEVYKRAANFYFPGAKVDIVMTIDVNGLSYDFENPPEPEMKVDPPVKNKKSTDSVKVKPEKKKPTKKDKKDLIQLSLFD